MRLGGEVEEIGMTSEEGKKRWDVWKDWRGRGVGV